MKYKSFYFILLVSLSACTIQTINSAPAQPVQSFQYVSQDQHVSFNYTAEFEPRDPYSVALKITPEIDLNLIDTRPFSNTNLESAAFTFGASSDDTLLQTCTEPASWGQPDEIIDEVDINGIQFVHSKLIGHAAGSTYERTYYRTAYEGVCYEVSFFVHSRSMGLYGPEVEEKEFDHVALMQKFEDILSTLLIK